MRNLTREDAGRRESGGRETTGALSEPPQLVLATGLVGWAAGVAVLSVGAAGLSLGPAVATAAVGVFGVGCLLVATHLLRWPGYAARHNFPRGGPLVPAAVGVGFALFGLLALRHLPALL